MEDRIEELEYEVRRLRKIVNRLFYYLNLPPEQFDDFNWRHDRLKGDYYLDDCYIKPSGNKLDRR